MEKRGRPKGSHGDGWHRQADIKSVDTSIHTIFIQTRLGLVTKIRTIGEELKTKWPEIMEKIGDNRGLSEYWYKTCMLRLVGIIPIGDGKNYTYERILKKQAER